MPHSDRILVIKHGALGDFILAAAPFAAIRAHHARAHIVLLTTKPYAALAEASPFFDEIWVDSRPKLWQWRAWLALRKRLRGGRFARVYDLQTSQRSSMYCRWMPKGTEWSGIAKGCSHPHGGEERVKMHTIDRQREQLRLAGLEHVPPPDISWLAGDVGHFALPEDYALLVPGGSAHRPEKRWPQAHFAALARKLAGQGITPVLLGTQAEKEVLEGIAAACPPARNLCGQTSFAEIASLARGARCAIGNDTGPMHIIAATGCASVVLFSAASNPALCAPRGEHVRIVQKAELAELGVEEVYACLGIKEWGLEDFFPY